MQLSTHYYVLFLSERTSRLFEGFRDALIEIHNARFPFANCLTIDASKSPMYDVEQLRDFLSKSDEHLAHYFDQDPLWIILVGGQKNLSLFETLTVHKEALIGSIVGEYAAVSSVDLGVIVWPIIKKVLAGTNDRAIHDLEKAAGSASIIMGLDAVASSLESDEVYSLFLEEGYHMKSAGYPAASLTPWAEVNEAIDDPVDIQVERVLAKGGDVVFLDSGSMIKYQRIALISP